MTAMALQAHGPGATMGAPGRARHGWLSAVRTRIGFFMDEYLRHARLAACDRLL
jgi:hypothetical protein